MEPEEEILRLNKFIAHCGICNRRKAADLIKKGEISVNEVVERNPFYELQNSDKVYYKGKLVEIEEVKVYLLFNKPKNMVISHPGEANKPDVMTLIRKKTDIKVELLDMPQETTAGLVILTNDNQVLDKYHHPDHRIKKMYHVLLDKEISDEDLFQIREGIRSTSGKYNITGIDRIEDLGEQALGVEIHIGNDSTLYQLFEKLGYVVTKMDRTYYAGLTKKDLKRGWSRFLTEKEVIFLKHFG
ncbi:MAG: rRNA pseudouridine synthase [Saprospiraceae bacterium]|nr:rRNA pseudouridine synthase [Saprospiraceae bacterium]